MESLIQQKSVPHKTVERLILYRSFISKMLTAGTTHTFSWQLAQLSGGTSAQVRRDLMYVGCFGTPQHGYDLRTLNQAIVSFFATEETISIVLVGVGNLGRAILGYLSLHTTVFNIVGAFDVDVTIIGRVIAGRHVYHLREIQSILAEKNVQVGIIAVPGDHAQECADILVSADVRGIVNFAPVPLHVPDQVYIENINMTMTIEKVAYFSRIQKAGGAK
jgi:redox-sensing transcriptional repressor